MQATDHKTKTDGQDELLEQQLLEQHRKPKPLQLGLIIITVLVTVYVLYQHQFNKQSQIHISGNTMGTYYSVKLVGKGKQLEAVDDLQSQLEALLVDVNQQMSTYQADSELSLFNKMQDSSGKVISADFAHVIKAALIISQQTQGAFDATLGPLVNLWGFGPQARPDIIPSLDKINQVKQSVGYRHLALSKNNSDFVLSKIRPNLYVDLSAIAKGYAVDKLSLYLQEQGLENYLVDIGGEIRVKGINQQGAAWRIAVEKPEAGQRSAQIKLSLKDVAIATSGDYRNYYEVDGKRYSHTIDPHTGKPISHNLISATVVHDNCMMADGYATALMVLGPEKGLEFANQYGLAVVLISKSTNGFNSEITSAMQQYLFK